MFRSVVNTEVMMTVTATKVAEVDWQTAAEFN